MTDPRAALADSIKGVRALDLAGASLDTYAENVERLLAERGVLLVTEAMLIQAIRIVISPTDAVEDGPAIFAALSAEVTE